LTKKYKIFETSRKVNPKTTRNYIKRKLYYIISNKSKSKMENIKSMTPKERAEHCGYDGYCDINGHCYSHEEDAECADSYIKENKKLNEENKKLKEENQFWKGVYAKFPPKQLEEALNQLEEALNQHAVWRLKEEIKNLEDRCESTALERDGALDDIHKLKEEIGDLTGEVEELKEEVEERTTYAVLPAEGQFMEENKELREELSVTNTALEMLKDENEVNKKNMFKFMKYNKELKEELNDFVSVFDGNVTMKKMTDENKELREEKKEHIQNMMKTKSIATELYREMKYALGYGEFDEPDRKVMYDEIKKLKEKDTEPASESEDEEVEIEETEEMKKLLKENEELTMKILAQ